MGKFTVALVFALLTLRPVATAPAFHAATLIDSNCAASTNTNAVTTSAINSTGADFLVAIVAYYSTGGGALSAPSAQVTDSKSNTWSQATDWESSGAAVGSGLRTFYAENPSSVGSSHTMTIGYGGSYPGICFMAFSGMATSSLLDVENGLGVSALNALTSLQPGSVTPSATGYLLISATAFGGITTSIAVDSSFTQLATSPVISAGNSFGISVGYLVGTTSAVNPTWTGTAPDFRNASDTVFVATGGGGATFPGGIIGPIKGGGFPAGPINFPTRRHATR